MRVIQKYTKFANFASVFFLCILQYFVTKLGNFTNFNVLCLAVVIDFGVFCYRKIQYKRVMVHCLESEISIQCSTKFAIFYFIFY